MKLPSNSGGTLCSSADALLENDAKEVVAYVMHRVLLGSAVARLRLA